MQVMSADLTIVTDSCFSELEQKLIHSSMSEKSNLVVLAKFIVKTVIHLAAYIAFEVGNQTVDRYSIRENTIWFFLVPVASVNWGGLAVDATQAVFEILGPLRAGRSIGGTGNLISGAIGGAVVAGGMVAAGLVGAIAGLIISGGIWCVAELIGNMCRRDIRY